MLSQLLASREQVMDRADAAIDQAWPSRSGTAYVQAMQAAAADIQRIAATLHAAGAPPIELSRTHRYLGSIYSDLAPALGADWLALARDAYLEAERLLPSSEQGLERAKLNFNFGNTLSQLNRDDPRVLSEARRRVQAARSVFAREASQYLAQVDQLTETIDRLLALAPMIQAVRRTQAELDDIGSRIRSGGDLQEIARDLRRVTKRDGGITGTVDRLRTVVADLPRDMKSDARFAQVTQMLDSLTAQAPNTSQTTGLEATVVPLLRERLARDERGGSVDPDRAQTLEAMIATIERRASRRDDSIESLIEYTDTIRRAASESIETLHYPSYKIARPPAGSHAAALVEECWALRRFLMEENIRPGKGSDESHELVELALRGSNVDKRIYEAGADTARARRVEHEELRPFALAVRSFSARDYSMLAAPIWNAAQRDADTNALLYAGPRRNAAQLARTCAQVGMELMAAPVGSGFADARWQQIQRAIVCVFDFRAPEGPERAAVAYELGIALTIGRPVVVLVSAGQVLPFDVDREPVIVDDGRGANAALQQAIRRAIVSTCSPTRGKGVAATLDEALARYARPHDNVYVDQTLRLLADQREEPDRLATSRTLAKLVQFLDDGKTVLISPAWSPVYPQAGERRLFHVMPFAPDWASDVAGVARAACARAGVRYVRGDEAADASVIRSIWEELARATHVLADLTGFNANVALELGIAHALGRPCLLVGQRDTVRSLFPMLAKQRLHSYDTAAEVDALLAKFVS